MTNVMPRYFEKCEEFFKLLIGAKCEKKFLEMMGVRADKIARDICLATDEGVTGILKGQLSICYELADGVREALKAKEGKANPDIDGGFPDEP